MNILNSILSSIFYKAFACVHCSMLENNVGVAAWVANRNEMKGNIFTTCYRILISKEAGGVGTFKRNKITSVFHLVGVSNFWKNFIYLVILKNSIIIYFLYRFLNLFGFNFRHQIEMNGDYVER